MELAKRKYPYNRPVKRRDISDSREISLYYWDNENVPLYGDEVILNKLLINGDRLERKAIKKEGLSEYFLYTIEGTETIADKWGKRLLSFETEDIEVKSLYKYDEQRWGNQTIRFVAFANDAEHNLGDTPIPNGAVKIYRQADEQGHLSYVGGTNIKYIPVDEEVELNLASARLVSVEPKLMDFKTDNYMFDKKDNIVGWDEIRTWKVEVTNTRELPVEVEITRGFDTAYWSLDYDGRGVSYEKHDATHGRFKTKLQPQSKRTFTYTVTTYHGRRQEIVDKSQGH